MKRGDPSLPTAVTLGKCRDGEMQGQTTDLFGTREMQAGNAGTDYGFIWQALTLAASSSETGVQHRQLFGFGSERGSHKASACLASWRCNPVLGDGRVSNHEVREVHEGERGLVRCLTTLTCRQPRPQKEPCLRKSIRTRWKETAVLIADGTRARPATPENILRGGSCKKIYKVVCRVRFRRRLEDNRKDRE